jgi:phosphatidylglycerophosphate synthase
MLDRYIVPIIKPPLRLAAAVLQRHSVSADQVTVAGFTVGLLSVVALAFGHTSWALFFLLMNRLADGVDGELARLQQPTDAGGFLDIVLDFIFYALFPIGFALLDPPANALPAAVLIASFVGTGASFLAFASMANKRGLDHPDFAYKSLYYLNGLAEGSETIACFVLMCLMPEYFAQIAWVFAGICVVTAINRVVSGYLTLRRD